MARSDINAFPVPSPVIGWIYDSRRTIVRLNPDLESLELAQDFGRNFARAVSGEDEILELALDYQKRANTNRDILVRQEDYIKSYANEDLIVYWNPARCTQRYQLFRQPGNSLQSETKPWSRLMPSNRRK